MKDLKMKDGNMVTKNSPKRFININKKTMKKKPKQKSVACCKCGIMMPPNAANIRHKCLPLEVDITDKLRKPFLINHCPECDTYRRHPRRWIKAQLESKELLDLCIKRLKVRLNKVKVVDAKFVWTEPHSKRIKVSLKVHKKELSGMDFEQAYTVEYVIRDKMCPSCYPDQWVAVVQLRQHVSDRRTFFLLEQLILKHSADYRAIRMIQLDQGIDFFFTRRSHALKFVDFVSRWVPVKSRHDKQLVPPDPKNNNLNYKYTFFVEISPICKDDLICLPPQVAASLGNIGPLVICTKVSNTIAFLDPKTLRHSFLDADQYWKAPFKPLLSSRELVEYVVLDIGISSSIFNIGGSGYVLVDVHVARVSDFGKNDMSFSGSTHLGCLLRPGDHAFGYDLYGANINDTELDNGLEIPKVILIKKSYEKKLQKRRGAPRPWKLNSLNMEIDNSSKERGLEQKLDAEYENFLRYLEGNPDVMYSMSLLNNKEYQPSKRTSIIDEEAVPLGDLLADLDLK